MRSLSADRTATSLPWDPQMRIPPLDPYLMMQTIRGFLVDLPEVPRWLFRQICVGFPWVQIRGARFVNQQRFAALLDLSLPIQGYRDSDLLHTVRLLIASGFLENQWKTLPSFLK